MPPKKKTKKITPKSLTKSQMKDLTDNLRSYTENHKDNILLSVSKHTKDDPCLKTDEQKHTLGILLNSTVISILCDGFLNLYKAGNKGRIMDKYALFQIKWSKYLSESLRC